MLKQRSLLAFSLARVLKTGTQQPARGTIKAVGKNDLELTNPPRFDGGEKCKSEQEPRIALNREMIYACMLRKPRDDFSWFSRGHTDCIRSYKKERFERSDPSSERREVTVK